MYYLPFVNVRLLFTALLFSNVSVAVFVLLDLWSSL